MGIKCKSYAAFDKSGKHQPYEFERRDVGDDDVLIDVYYCGVCHSDIHAVRAEWNAKQQYPVVPGHEMVGKVLQVGPKVTKYKVDDYVAVGTLVDSCQDCGQCKKHLEQYCENKATYTYGDSFRGAADPGQRFTMGGYSSCIVVKEGFVFSVPQSLVKQNFAATAPLLCAGITVYSPIVHFLGKQLEGQNAAVIGLGGLGHLAVKFLKAMGARVTVISRSDAKKATAMKSLKADAFLVSSDAEQMRAAKKTFDAIINTVSAKIDVPSYCELLRVDGKLILVGLPPTSLEFRASTLINRRLSICGSLVGGTEETQDMLEFCGQHGIVADVEIVGLDKVDIAHDRCVQGDVQYRFVLDIKN